MTDAMSEEELREIEAEVERLHVECLKQCERGEHGAMMPTQHDENGYPAGPWQCEECGWVES